jgi:dTDP-4-dehydrorhamnose reductase
VLFSPLALRTVVQSIELVMQKPRGGVFNLGSSGGMSKADFAYHLAKSAGLAATCFKRVSLASRSLAARRPRDMRMNSQAFMAAFDAPEVRLTDEIDRVARGYRDAAR